ncbi:MAG: endolytic transglycosylase MltG [Actinobacteria bacterium]|nr:MAG: endolytic transglycosylase MltG [Actinomycetota bacterium]
MTSASRRAWPRARRVHMRQARTRAPPPTCSRAGSPSEGVKVQPLTRGKRSQPSPHRTEEERERDRADRERRRAERAGEDSPPVAPPVPPLPRGGEPPIVPATPAPAGDGFASAQPAPSPEPVQPAAEREDLAHVEPAEAPPPARPDPQIPPHEHTEMTGPAGAPPIAGAATPEPVVPPPAPPSTGAATPQPLTDEHAALEKPLPVPVAQAAREDPAAEQAVAGTAAVHEAPAVGPRLPPAPPARSTGGPIAMRGHRLGARRPAGRPPLPRALALVALAAVVAAVVLLAKSLAGGGQEKRAPVAPVSRVVIPEGSTRLQIAQIAAADGLKGSYRGASKHSSLLDPTHYGAPAGTHDLEGFLFPATYDMVPSAPVSRLVHEQLVAFRENVGSSAIARAHALRVTPYQLLTIASMVEREAKVPGDRAKIAAVIYNRLKKGMPLGIDATIYYALEMQKGIATYTKELTAAQLQLNSAYNTRTRTGLPPTPISNPGLASIEAAMKPAHVAYLYYVLAADGCGEHAFATTLAKFEADAAAYQTAVKKNGGSPPSCKK